MNKKKENSKNYPELYYKVLEECSKVDQITRSDLFLKLGLSSESDSIFRSMSELEFIDSSHDSIVKLLPQGFSTYLAISSQKQSAEQARKATKVATWALAISIITFLTSIVFSILS